MSGKLLLPLAPFLFLLAFSQSSVPARPILAVANMEKLNSPADDDDPSPAPDGMRFLFASNRNGVMEIFLAERPQRNHGLANPRPIEELSSKLGDLSPFLMPQEKDGSEYVYFSSPRDAKAKNLDIFFTRRLKGDAFQRGAIAGVHQVCTEEDEADPWLTADGRELYFSRKTKDGWRAAVARGKDPRAFERVELLNLPAGFRHPCLSPDGLTMFLQGPVDQNRTGLFRCRRPRGGAWGKPEPIASLNHPEGPTGDRSPRLSPDGRFLYFASDRPGGKGGLDLYVVPVNEAH